MAFDNYQRLPCGPGSQRKNLPQTGKLADDLAQLRVRLPQSILLTQRDAGKLI